MSYVLLIEDNQDNADMMIRLLETLDLQVYHCVRGLEGVQQAAKAAPLMVLLDFNLPDIDGRSLILTLKKRLQGPLAAPIVAVTARTGAVDEQLAMRFGCDAFVRKPFDPEDFLALVTQLLGRDA